MSNKTKPVKRAYNKRAVKQLDNSNIILTSEARLLGILLANFNALDEKGQQETLNYIVEKVGAKQRQ